MCRGGVWHVVVKSGRQHGRVGRGVAGHGVVWWGVGTVMCHVASWQLGDSCRRVVAWRHGVVLSCKQRAVKTSVKQVRNRNRKKKKSLSFCGLQGLEALNSGDLEALSSGDVASCCQCVLENAWFGNSLQSG